MIYIVSGGGAAGGEEDQKGEEEEDNDNGNEIDNDHDIDNDNDFHSPHRTEHTPAGLPTHPPRLNLWRRGSRRRPDDAAARAHLEVMRWLCDAGNAIDSEAIQDDLEAVRDREKGVRQRPCGCQPDGGTGEAVSGGATSARGYALVAPSASSADSS